MVLASHLAIAGGEQSLFEEAFGHAEPQGPQLVTLQLELDGQPAGWATARVIKGEPERELRVQAAPLLQALAPRLRDELLERLTTSVEARGLIALAALEEAGLIARYDGGRLLLQLSLPAPTRRVVVGDLSRRPGHIAATAPQAQVSGFLNVRVAEDFDWIAGRAEAVRAPMRLGLESALNVRGFVLEARGELAEGPLPRWTQGDVRLVADDVPHAMRFVAGDLATPPSSFLRPLPLLGLGAARNFSLDPSRQLLPEESMAFLLERPSKVEVFTNGRLTQTLHLAEGAHDLRGLTLQGGANELELLITDELGAQRRLIRRVGLAAGQLGLGVVEGSFALGFPLDQLALARGYLWTEPVLSGSYRRGLTSALTLGGAVQASPTIQAADVEPLLATWLGSVALRGALSHRVEVGWAVGLRYELQRSLFAGRPSLLQLGGEYRSPEFTLPGEPLGALRPSYRFDASLGQTLAEGFSGRLHAQVTAEQGAAAPRLQGTLSFSKGFANGLGLMLDLTGAVRSASPGELRVRLNAVWAWPSERRSVQVLTELDQDLRARARLTGNQTVRLAEHQLHASASVAQDSLSRGTAETLSYRGQRADASISHRLSGPLNGSPGVANTLQLRLGTALVFADGVFAWSRPVSGSFVIVAPVKVLEGQLVELNATSQGRAGAIDGLGPAVLPDLQPYLGTQVNLLAPALKVGTSLGQERFVLVPGFRRGALVRVGEEGDVLLRGRLSWGEGPATLASGTLQPRGGGPGVPFFTNRTGRFVITGLAAGTYTLQLDEPSAPLTIEIPAHAPGLLDLGQRELTRL